MKIVVGGLGRKTGKTTLVCRIIALSKERRWTAVKVSHHAPRSGLFEIAEEPEAGPSGDTRRYLAAGAARAFWLRGDAEKAVPALLDLLAQAENWIVESTRLAPLLPHDYAFLAVDPDHIDDGKLCRLLGFQGKQHRHSQP